MTKFSIYCNNLHKAALQHYQGSVGDAIDFLLEVSYATDIDPLIRHSHQCIVQKLGEDHYYRRNCTGTDRFNEFLKELENLTTSDFDPEECSQGEINWILGKNNQKDYDDRYAKLIRNL